MNKYTYFLLASSLTIFLAACNKKANPPTIELIGSKLVTNTLNADFVDPGAKATDNKGDDISTDVVVTGEVDVDLVGDYLLFYDVADKKGNNAHTVKRTVQVRNEEDYLDGFYAVSYDFVSATIGNFSGTTIDEVRSSNTINKRFYLSQPVAIYCNVVGNDITIPSQGSAATGRWSGSGDVRSNGDINIDLEYESSTDSYSYTVEYDKH